MKVRKNEASKVQVTMPVWAKKLFFKYEHGDTGPLLFMDDNPNIFKRRSTPVVSRKVGRYMEAQWFSLKQAKVVAKQFKLPLEEF